MKKVLFVVPNMCGGGAERVMLNLLKHLPRDQFELNLAIVQKTGVFLSELPGDINIFDLKAGRVRYAVSKIVKLVNEINPDTVFSTLGHLNIALIASKKLWKNSASIIIREGTIASTQNSTLNKGFFWNLLYRSFYPKADKIICQSKAMENDLIGQFHIPKERIVTIYNPIDWYHIGYLAGDVNPFHGSEGPNIISVGRLAKEKAFDKLILAFPELLSKHKGARLWILGEGRLRNYLQELSYQHSVSDRVYFVGFQENPYTWMAHADLFVLSSIYEGLPNVLLEAIACGCPVVSLEHPGGTREILEITGQLDRYVKELTWEDRWFNKPSPEVMLKLKEHFGLDKVINQYVNVLNELL